MKTFFNILPGNEIVDKYKVLNYLGCGWEGEVYKIVEKGTGIERAAKIFFPNRNVKNKAVIQYAKKLHKLRHCPMLIHYHTMETLDHHGVQYNVFISEYIEGELLEDHLRRFRGRRLPLFQALHLLYQLAVGVESIHNQGEYHGDLHAGNIIVQGVALKYELKFLDLYYHGRSSQYYRQLDLLDIIRIFYTAIGGQKYYSKHPSWVHYICCGLKKSLILKKFKTVTELRVYLETESSL